MGDGNTVMKTRGSRKTRTNKNHLSDEAFADLKEALEDAPAFERRERSDLKVTRIQAPRPPEARPREAGTFR